MAPTATAARNTPCHRCSVEWACVVAGAGIP